MRRAGIVDQKRAQEAAFTAGWISENPERKTKYGEALPQLAKAYEELQSLNRATGSLVPQLSAQ